MKELPLEPANYGLYLNGKPGKFLDEARLLSDYSVQEITQLEVSELDIVLNCKIVYA